MKYKTIHKLLTYCIAIIWLTNGLFCKVMNFVPRHQQIVAGILGDKLSRTLTVFFWTYLSLVFGKIAFA